MATIADALKSCTRPLIVVDAVDLAAAAETVHLARAVSGILNHTCPDNVALLQEQGWLGTTPGEATLRSDAVLLVGPLQDEIATDEALRRLCNGNQARAFRYIGKQSPPNTIANLVERGLAGTNVGDMSLTGLIGALRAHVAGHALVTENEDALSAIAALGDWLKAARYGVAVFATGALSDLEGHALAGLLDDLSQDTRWNALPLAVPQGQNELQRISTSLTGLPTPSAFDDGRAVHDRWKYDGRKVLERGECDAVLWISASERKAPDWITSAPAWFAISANENPIAGATAQIEIGIAGVDYDAIVEPAEIGAFTALSPPQTTERAAAASIIAQLRTRIEGAGAASP